MAKAIVLPTAYNFKNLTGERYGRLEVLSYAGKNRSRQSMWSCRCECGTEAVVAGYHLSGGHTQSCGCLRLERLSAANTKHGASRSSEYQSWLGMLKRCYNTNGKAFSNYGGRGLRVCSRWKNSFEKFFEDIGPRPTAKHTIERKDNSLGYCKENCVWATRKQQNRNRRSNRRLTFNGKTQLMVEWEEELGLPKGTISSRVTQYGWSVERALTSPVHAVNDPEYS
jgi:hypothetical protein